MERKFLNKAVFGITVFLFLLTTECLTAQTLVYAQAISSENEVDNNFNAIDGNQTTYATVRASTGIALGVGAYSGHLELEFSSTVSANTTTYVKVEADDNLFDVLLSGGLGNLVSDVLGIVLIGNQEFTVQVKMDNTVLLTGNSEVFSQFDTPNLRVVINEQGESFIAITPNADYNRIRLTNRVGSLLGLNNTKELKVYSAHYVSSPSECGMASYTSYDGDGLTLDLLNLGGAGVTNPHHVIDADLNSYSELSLGIISVAGSIEQIVYFDGLSSPNDVFNIRLRLDPSLVTLGVANNITITSYNGQNIANTITLNGLLNLDLLTLLQNNQITTIPYSPGMPIDRVSVKYTALLNTSLFQKLDLYDIIRVPASPTIDVNSQNVTICSNTSASLIAYSNPSSLLLYWYDVETGGTPVAIVNSGDAFVTPPLTNTTTYYVAAKNPNCPEESNRIPVTVTVGSSPNESDLSVTGNENPICAINSVILTPSSTITGSFHWYFDANGTNEITNGLTIGNVNYSIDSNGVLTITGLDSSSSPLTYYLSISDVVSGCSNTPGNLKVVTIDIVDEITPTTSDNTQDFCISQNPTVSDLQSNESGVVWYNLPTGGTPLDPTTPLVNGSYYGAIIGTVCESSIRLEIIVTINDESTPTTSDSTQDFCVSQNPTVADLQANESGVVWYNSPTSVTPLDPTTPLASGNYYGAISGSICESSIRLEVMVTINDEPTPTTNSNNQEFCLSENPTVADLQTNETPVVWYSSPTGGTPLDPSTALSNGTYYAAIAGPMCESSVRLEVTVLLNSNNIASIDGEMNNICYNNIYTYTTESGMSNYEWTVTGGTIVEGGNSSSDFVTVDWDDAMTGNITVTYYSSSLCNGLATNSIDVTINMCSNLTITKVADKANAAVGETVVFTITVTNNGNSDVDDIVVSEYIPSGYAYVSSSTTLGNYDVSTGFWNIDELLANTSAILTVTVTVNPSGNYVNTATIITSGPLDDPDDNAVLAEVDVICLTVYNEFSPNGDGENDYFIIDCIESYPNNYLNVFNRYGNVVYEVSGYQNNWNGVSNVNGVINKNEALPVGTYFYVLKVDELNYSKSGWLYIAR